MEVWLESGRIEEIRTSCKGIFRDHIGSHTAESHGQINRRARSFMCLQLPTEFLYRFVDDWLQFGHGKLGEEWIQSRAAQAVQVVVNSAKYTL